MSFDEGLVVSDDAPAELLALDQALDRLRELDVRQYSIVALRFFAGLEIEEVAQMIDISSRTAKRDWVMAKVWLKKELEK